MKKLRLLFFFIFVSTLSFAQHWSELMTKPIPNYYEVKTAFDKEWDNKPYEKGRGISSFYRWEEFMLNHMDRDGNYDPSSDRNSLEIIGSTKTKETKTSGGTWTQLGPNYSPNPDGNNNDGIGRVKDIAFHPTDTNIFYVASSTGGLYKTTDFGLNYSFLSADWPFMGIINIVLNESNPNELWVSTRYYIYHTTNSGVSWTTIIPQRSGVLESFIVNIPANRIVTTDAFGYAFYSMDNGTTWTEILSLKGISIEELVSPTSNPSIIYGDGEDGLYKSTDGGLTFSNLNATGITFGSTANRIALSDAEPNSVWILAVESSELGGIYKSTNGGTTFTSILSPSALVKSARTGSTSSREATAIFRSQGWIHAALGVSNTDPNTIYWGGVGVAFTDDGGTNWNYGAEGWADETPHVDYLNFRFQPKNDRVYACCDGGIYREIKGRNDENLLIWESMNENLPITQMYNLAVSHDGKKIITGQQDNGSFFYDVEKSEWTFLVIGDGMANGFDAANNETAYVANQRGSLYKSQFGTNSFSSISSLDDATTESSAFRTEFHTDKTKSGVIYQLRDNLWRSKDYGKTWENLTSSISESYKNGKLEFSYGNPEVLALIDGSKGLYLTQDNGVTWSKIQLPLNGFGNPIWAYNVALHSTDKNTLWVETSDEVYQSTDLGTNWTKVEYGTQLYVEEMLHVDGTDNELLLATNLGVYVKGNNLNSVSKFGAGLPNLVVKDMEINYCSNQLYVATFGGGVWKAPITFDEITCCKVGPEFSSSSANYLCSSGSVLSVTGSPTNVTWLKDGLAFDQNTTTITATEEGVYEVFSKSSNCESSHTSVWLKDLSSNEAGFDIDFEDGTLDENITVIRENGHYPFEISNDQACDSVDVNYLTFLASGSLVNRNNDILEFVLPESDLSNADTASFNFDVSTRYADFSTNTGTNMTVLISEDCGATYNSFFYGDEGTIGTNKGGTGSIDITDCNDWKNFSLDLKDYLGKKVIFKVQFGSKDYPGNTWWGTKMHMDNFKVSGELGTTPVGIAPDFEKVNVSAFPNPVVNILTVESEETIESMEVYSMAGRKIDVRIRPNQIDTSLLEEGVYVLKVQTNEGYYSLNFIKVE